MATRRGYYREELDRAVHNINMCLTHISRVVEAYESDHPEISQSAREIAQALILIGEAIIRLHDSI